MINDGFNVQWRFLVKTKKIKALTCDPETFWRSRPQSSRDDKHPFGTLFLFLTLDVAQDRDLESLLWSHMTMKDISE